MSKKKKKAKQLARKAEKKRVRKLSRKLSKTIRTLAGNPPGPTSAATFWPTSSTSATGADRVPPGLDDAGLVLHATIARRGANTGDHYFSAMAKLTGNPSYAELSDIPPANPIDQPGVMTQLDPERRALYTSAVALAKGTGIGFMDACTLLDNARELRELEADDGSSHVDWLDSSERPTPPRPYGQGAVEDWERDQRRAAAAGVEIDHAAWQAGAELGSDVVGQLADAQRADRIAALKERSANALSKAQTREDQRRLSAINDELTSRARQRTQQARHAAAAPSPHSSYYQP